MKCPECGNEECWRDEVDIGVGTQYGPWRCDECGWMEESNMGDESWHEFADQIIREANGD